MKNFIGLLVFALVILNANANPPEEFKEKFREVNAKCAEESKVDKSELERFKSGDFAGASPEFKCYSSCFAREMGFIANGEPNTEKMKEVFSKMPKFSEEKFNRIVNECKSEYTGEDDCEKGFNYMACEKKIMFS
ncbi:general odorant-binding protein 56d-like [Condylostylus longicornis]|uniref:general odorant-binding protein 56d-like n=1 Tax=Condylostylus longicornis TaxID=2530218 RepID=UPI00244DE830|nr:general odorant-binding protein 56d-like [Condylostylus longicornis]